MSTGALVRIVSGDTLSELTPLLQGEASLFLVYDEAVAEWAQVLASALPLRGLYPVRASEQEKSMGTVLEICRFLLEHGADRDALVLALGGGITTDMAGFAASVYKRGVRFVPVPTTLLAQVDAAVGGKTGVNLDGYKNMIGVIRQPEFTFVCADVLKTLPRHELVCGAAELLKTFLIDNVTLPDGTGAYAAAVDALSAIRKGKSEPVSALRPFIAAAAGVKASIVTQDPEERGLRRVLNLGHTFAHALEWRSRQGDTALSHGEAVAVGICLAARVSERRGLAEAGFASRIEADFRRAGLPVDCPWPPREWMAAMARDKKAFGGKVNFILLRGVGDVLQQPMTVEEAAAALS